MAGSFINIQNLRKVYRLGNEKVVALAGVNLEIKRGEICCILGTSGSGKSTLLNQLAGLEKPTKGEVIINGVNVSKLSENQLAKFRQKNVGFVFQSYNLLPQLTALENVAMPLMFRGMGRRKRDKIALQMLTEVGLKSRAKHKPTQMSGGQQQRVGIARAFVAKPKIVFADEPTGNLDSKTTVEVMEMMVRMSRANKQTFILVTHDNNLAKYADRIVRIVDGQVVSDEANVSIVPIEPPKAVESSAQQEETIVVAVEQNGEIQPDEETGQPEYVYREETPPQTDQQQELTYAAAQTAAKEEWIEDKGEGVNQ